MNAWEELKKRYIVKVAAGGSLLGAVGNVVGGPVMKGLDIVDKVMGAHSGLIKRKATGVNKGFNKLPKMPTI